MNRLCWRLLRLICTVWRLGTLRIVNTLLRSTSSPCVLSRRFCGGRLHLDVGRSAAQGQLFLLGENHVDERFLLAELITPGMTIVDVGANIGYYVLLFAKLGGPRSTIIAIEPSPETLPELRLNIANNHLSSVRLIASAVGAEAGSVSFNAGLNGGVAQAGVYTVPIAALDDLVHRFGGLLEDRYRRLRRFCAARRATTSEARAPDAVSGVSSPSCSSRRSLVRDDPSHPRAYLRC